MKQFLIIGAVCSTVLVACNSANMDEITRKSNNTCFFEKITPAEISTRIETRVIRAEKRDARGQLISPTQYETTRTQTITKPRSVTKIDAVCPEDLTPEFIASLQHAFQVRGLFSAPVTGFPNCTWNPKRHPNNSDSPRIGTGRDRSVIKDGGQRAPNQINSISAQQSVVRHPVAPTKAAIYVQHPRHFQPVQPDQQSPQSNFAPHQ